VLSTKQRVIPDLLRRPRINARAHRRGHHLRPETNAERRSSRVEPASEALHLARDPRMLVLLVNSHRPAHHDEQIGFAEVDRTETGIGDIDARQIISRSLDRFAIAGNPLMGDMADDESGSGLLML
jgi:hypothetical protein